MAKKKAAAAAPADPPPLPRVWVVDHYIGQPLPRVAEYALLRRGDQSVTVRYWGTPRVIREANGRSFYYDRVEMVAAVRQIAATAAASLRRQAAECDAAAEDGPDYIDVVGDGPRVFPKPEPGWLD